MSLHFWQDHWGKTIRLNGLALLVLLLLSCLRARCQEAAEFLLLPSIAKAPAGGGGAGPYTNYSAGASPSAPANSQGWGGDWFLGAAVTCTNAGNITAVGARLSNSHGVNNCNIRVSLWWNNGGTWTYVDCNNVFIAGGQSSPTWYDITLGTPFAVTAGQVVRVFIVGDTGDATHYYAGTSGGYSGTKSYANGCNSTMPTVGDDYQFGVRTIVQ